MVFPLSKTHYAPGERYPLSLSQQNIWDIERACPDTSINNICTTLHVQGRVDFSALQRSVNLVLSADPSLRTQITMVDKTPMQYQTAYQHEPIPVYDFSQTTQEGIERWQESFTRETMPLLDSPLYRFVLLHTSENAGCLVIKMHHLISDGWTQVLVCNRIGQCYLDLLAGREPELGDIPSYVTHLEDEQRYLTSSAYTKDEAYWNNVLEQSGEPSTLKSVRGAALSYVGNRLTFPLPQDLNNDIYTFCMRRRIAPFSVFYLALAIYFKRIGGADRFTIGVPIFNRKNFVDKQTSGMFVSTLPFFSEISGDWTFNEFSDHLNVEWFDMLRHQRFPLDDIRKLAQQHANKTDRLFHIAFSYQNGQLQASKDATVSFSGRWHYSGYQMEQLCIHLSNLEDNRRYSVDYDYLTQLFSDQEIHTLHNCLVNILREALASPDRPIGQLAILSHKEREMVLYSFNRSAHPIFDPSLYDRFSRQCQQTPNRVALIHDGQRTTYQQLEAYAARIHATLSGICAAPDTLVAILLPRVPELFGSMMGILRAGGAFLLLSPNQPENRIREILTQSGTAVLLTTSELGGHFADLLPVIDITCLPSPIQRPAAQYRPEGLAYVVYTSGSTGTPKGVEISCRSLLNLACAMEPIYGKGAVLSVCSMGFDAFLLESVCAMLNGCTILLPQDEQLESPQALAQLIRGYGVGFLSTTPSRMSAFLKDESFRQAMAGMESIVCGGEAFPSDLLQRLRLDTPARIYNQYGPSETTVAVSVKQLNEATAITAGGPMSNCKLYILDNWGNPLPIGIYGNLYVGGVCVGRGYRNAPELTAGSFSESPFELGDRLYQTGDLARWTPDGEIVLAGRSDRQVKLRGLRVEPQEVAECLARHHQVRQSAACVQQHSGQDVLLAFYTSELPISEDELRDLCACYLPHYMIPSAIMRLEEIPLTANGKVNEALLPHPDLTSCAQMEPQTQLQQTLLAIFRRVLGRPDLGVDSDYFLFGGNSLNAMEALGEITEQTGRTLRVADLYSCRSVLRLSALLDREGGIPILPVQRLLPAPALERWPLTPIQQGIYVQTHLDPTGKTYFMAGAFRLASTPDIPRLEQAFRDLIAHEPLLRTAFLPESDGIFARVQAKADFVLPVLQGADLEEAAKPLMIPFQLDQAPLLRCGLWEETPGNWILLMNIHHIIGDGLTTPILLSKLDALYQGRSLPAEPLNYLDYAWHLTQQQNVEGRMDYWKEHFAALPDPLDIPSDFPRSHEFDFLGDTVSFSLSRELSDACDAFCAEKGISPYMFFLGVFGLLMSRLSGKDDILIGSPAAGRLLPETRTMCGPFINTLPLRLNPRGDSSVEDYLAGVCTEVNNLLDHQQVGLEEIVSALGLKRTLSQSPLFQVIFSQRPIDSAAFTLDGKPLEHIPLSTGTARMDLWTELSKENGCYTFHTEYASQLFLKETVTYFGRCLETLTRSMLGAKDSTLAQLEALSAQDRMELIDIPNNTVYPFLNLPIPTQFARHLSMDPDAPAVIFHGKTTTRRELDQRACQIANLLAQAGAVPGCRVGIALSRSTDLVAAVLAIWKVGGAYAPLLAHYPEQRLAYMVDIAGITHILCDDKTQPQLPTSLPAVQVSIHAQAESTFQAVPLRETDLAEVLFTSGSTGQPKGVMLRWRSIANMAGAFREILSRSDGPILCTTNVVFDMFNGETSVPLSMGKTIVMADEEEMMLPWKLAEIIERDGVKITQSTPSRVQMWFSNEAFCKASTNLELMIYGGEVLTETLLRQAQTASNEAAQVNMYGPVEGTIYNTTRPVDYRKYINVGWPMRNNRIYLLDGDLKPVLPTSVGDIYLAGECVTEGYISRPDLTESAYLPDPFFPGERMYRTGDIGRLRLDGSYDFLGRRDAQVKLNGQRVELDEINGAFVSQGCALQAATVPVRQDDGSMQLFTYYIPVTPALSDREIRSKLGVVLPAYMIPSRMIPMDSMPSTPTGKINLRVLREMAESGEIPAAEPVASQSEPAQAASADPEPAFVPPVPETAQQVSGEVGSLDWILTLWSRMLNRRDLNADCSFFEQGGTSLAALSVLSYYNNSQISMTLAQFYEMPSARQQAEFFRPQDDAPTPAAVESAPPAAAACEAVQSTPGQDDGVGSPDWILALWRRVLNRNDLDAERSFFEQGGTSLAALSVLSHYNNSHLPMSLAQFYAMPSARLQAEHFGSGPSAAPVPEKKAVSLNLESLTSAPTYPRQVPPLATTPGRKRGMKSVLLTGATGFLGAHMLRALLENGVSKVICTMRDGSLDRLVDTLAWYFGRGWADDLGDQIEVIRADISCPGLGLSPMEYQTLSGRINAIWNCAADVRHYAADSSNLLRTNLEGTRVLIKLARAAGIPLYHMSTTSVGGNRLVGQNTPAVFTEHDFDIGQDWRSNLYVRSKFLAEHEVFEAIRSGLTAKVFRLGRLVGRSQDGIFQKNAQTNAFWLTMRGIHALGAIPASMAGMPMELTPIDWCAQAALALRNAPLAVYHLQGMEPPTVEACARCVVPDLQILPDEQFETLLASAPVDISGNILAPLLDLWNQLKSGPATITVDSTATAMQLKKANFDCSVPGPERLLRSFRFSPDECIRKETESV